MQLPKVARLVGAKIAGPSNLVEAHHVAHGQAGQDLDSGKARVRIGGFQRGGRRGQQNALVDGVSCELVQDPPGSVVQRDGITIAQDLEADDPLLLFVFAIAITVTTRAIVAVWVEFAVHREFGASRELVHFWGPQAIVQIKDDHGRELGHDIRCRVAPV